MGKRTRFVNKKRREKQLANYSAIKVRIGELKRDTCRQLGTVAGCLSQRSQLHKERTTIKQVIQRLTLDTSTSQDTEDHVPKAVIEEINSNIEVIKSTPLTRWSTTQRQTTIAESETAHGRINDIAQSSIVYKTYIDRTISECKIDQLEVRLITIQSQLQVIVAKSAERRKLVTQRSQLKEQITEDVKEHSITETQGNTLHSSLASVNYDKQLYEQLAKGLKLKHIRRAWQKRTQKLKRKQRVKLGKRTVTITGSNTLSVHYWNRILTDPEPESEVPGFGVTPHKTIFSLEDREHQGSTFETISTNGN